MASVNFSEKEYGAVASAAFASLRSGDRVGAEALNELAAKMNKALSIARFSGVASGLAGSRKFVAPGPIDKELGIVRG